MSPRLLVCLSTYFSLPPPARPPKEPLVFCGRIISTSVCGRAITCTDTSSPTRRAAAAPASVAALTAPTSPRTITVTYPAPMYSLPINTTLAALTMASAASIEPIRPFVSTIPSASSVIVGRKLPYCGGSNNCVTLFRPHEIFSRARCLHVTSRRRLQPQGHTGPAGRNPFNHARQTEGRHRQPDPDHLQVRCRAGRAGG